MNEIPHWWEFVLLALASFRVYRLIAEDTILDRPRNKLLRLSAGWRDEQEQAKRTGAEYVPPPEYREKWALFLTCPWCLGFWLSVIWWIAWLVFPTETIWFAVPWALSAVVALTAKNLDKEDE